MYKVIESNGNISEYKHVETLYYKILAMTGNHQVAMKISDLCLYSKLGLKYSYGNFVVEVR